MWLLAILRIPPAWHVSRFYIVYTLAQTQRSTTRVRSVEVCAPTQLLRPPLVDEVERGEVLENKQRNPELEVPFLGLVAKELHRKVHTDCTKSCRQKKQKPFGRTFVRAAVERVLLVGAENKKCEQINSSEYSERQVRSVHTSYSIAPLGLSQ